MDKGYTSKELVKLLEVTKMALSKALKNSFYTLKKVEGSTKPVKHYKLEDLPERYKKKLEDKGIKEKKQKKEPAAFTRKYLLATPDKQKLALAKVKLIEMYLKRNSTLNQEQWILEVFKNDLNLSETLGRVSKKQLNDWLKKYNEADAKALNVVEEFIDSRGASRGVKALSDEQKETAQRYFLRETRPKVTEIYRNMCHTYGDTMPSYDVLNKYFKEWKIKNPVLHEMSVSPDSAKNKYLAAWGDMSAKAKYRNHYWELDSTPADVICDDGRRYTVLSAVDIHTRRSVFHVCETSSSFTISQLLRKAILKFGIPENVVIDNGKDYTSNHFHSICSALKINMIVVPPFSGECKPHVERIFGTLSRELFEQIPGYIGHNVGQREELQARQSFRHKIESQRKWREQQKLRTKEEKDAWRDAWKLKKENRGLNLNILFTAEQLQLWIDKWNDKIYEQRRHGNLGTKPILKWNSQNIPVKSISDVRMLDLLLGESQIRKVGKKGISLDGCTYVHDELIELTGQSVYVLVPDEMGKILIYNMDMQFVCIAKDELHMGESRSEIKRGRKKSAAWMRQLNKIVEEAQEAKDTTILDRIEAVEDVIESRTYAVQKESPAINMLKDSIPNIHKQEQKELDESNRYDFKTKDEEGKPTKVLKDGSRPLFNSPYERFIWCLENKQWNDKDEKAKQRHPKIYEMAYREVKGA